MSLKLKKQLFSRNKEREKDIGEFFNKTSSGLTNIMPLIITVFFTPAIITTSFFSKEIIVILANASLCLGYLSNFAYRLYHREISKSELLVTLFTLALFLTLAYFLFPALGALSLITVLGFVNQMAIATNLFFLMKHVVVPPCKQMLENIAQYMGLDIAGRYYSKPPLSLERDRFVIDQLLKKTYEHDSFSEQFNPKEIKVFNKLLNKLLKYINKYDASILGYIKNKEEITDLEQQIEELTIQGNPDSAYTFIRKKIGFKTTKLKLLQNAEILVTEALEKPENDSQPALGFFHHVDHKKDKQELLQSGLSCLKQEIHRQEKKLRSLNNCLPLQIL
jgi:hypothetical protein